MMQSRRFGTHPRWAILQLFPLVVALPILGIFLAWSALSRLALPPIMMLRPERSQPTTLSFPLIRTHPNGLAGAQPIWSHAQAPAPHEIVLFRRQFSLETELSDAELSIFADTHYEAWLDGEWIGRGPARFSATMQEYDEHSLGDLPPGTHQVAVLVQWAPNARRSDSMAPLLLAEVRGQQDGMRLRAVGTDARWRALASDAWQLDAPLVHAWRLIGPTEILDLARLPEAWPLASFDDQTWPAAVVGGQMPPALAARSIPLLTETPRPPLAVVEAGVLSPGRALADLPPVTPSGGWQTREFVAPAASVLRLESLTDLAPHLDGVPLPPATPLDVARRPDVRVLELPIEAGRHTLALQPPPDGSTVALSLGGVPLDLGLPLVPSLAGTRMLLAEPIPGTADAPRVMLSEQGADLVFEPSPLPRYVTLDVGRTAHGRVSFHAEGPAGTVVEVGWDERLWDGRPLPAPGSLHADLWQQVDSWRLDGTPRTLSTLDARAGRYLLVQVWGSGPVRLSRLHVREEHYPVAPLGSFESSDPLLNRIWQVGIESLLPNMNDAYTDTPWRERGQWWADAVSAYGINEVSFGDTALLARGLRQVGRSFGTEGQPVALAPGEGGGGRMVDFGMQWIEGLYRYGRATGDSALAQEMYPTALRFMAFLASYENEAGLLDIPLGLHWSQSALVDWAGSSSRDGESTALNALYAASLGWMGEISEGVGDPGSAGRFRSAQARVSESLNQRLYLDDQQGYTASRLPDGFRPPAPQAQAWALAHGVVPAARQAAVADALLAQLSPFDSPVPQVELSGLRWVFAALAATGHMEEALDLMRTRYGAMLERGATTWWESFHSDGNPGASLSHAWGGSPTWALSSFLLGAQQPRVGTWHVAPQPGSVRWVRGTLPLQPSGTLAVEWSQEPCGSFSLTVNAPATMPGSILVPVEAPASVRLLLDDTPLWDGGPTSSLAIEQTSAGLLLPQVSGGAHTLLVEARACERLFFPFQGQ